MLSEDLTPQLLQAQHVGEVVEAGGLGDEEAGGAEGAAGEDVTAVRVEAQLEALAEGGEDSGLDRSCALRYDVVVRR